MIKFRNVGTLLILLALSACQHMRYGLIESHGPLLGAADIQTLQSQIRAGPRANSLRLLTRSSAHASAKAEPVRYAIAAVRNGSWRIDVLPPQAAYSLAIITSQAGAVQLLDVGAKQAVSALRAEDLLRRTMHIPIRSEDLFFVLLGELPDELLAPLDGSVWHGTPQQGWFISARSGSLRAELEAQSLRVLRLQLLEQFSGELAVDIRYRYKTANAAAVSTYPIGLDLTYVSAGELRTLDYQMLKIDAPLSPELFKVGIPDSYSRVELTRSTSPVTSND